MHVLESYALQNDLKIDKPFINEKFFPLAVGKFITIDTSNLKTASLAYSHWQLVVNYMTPHLEDHDIKVVHLGDKGCAPLAGCYTAVGQCNFNQKAYVIKKSLVHASPNNESSHVASLYNKKAVVIYPHNCYPSQFTPYWTQPKRLKIIKPSSNQKPSFNPNESPRSIDTIPPEDIAQKILLLAGIKDFSPSFKTLQIGAAFSQRKIESDLTHLLDIEKLGIGSLIVRMDLNHNEDALRKQLEGCACSIITKRPLSIELIEKYHKKIIELVYYIQDDNDPNFIRKIKQKSIQYLLRSRQDEKKTADFKLDYFDYGLVEHIRDRNKDDFKNLKGKNKIYYKSNRFIIHENNFYPSTAALLRNIHATPSMEHEPHEIIDDPLFWEEGEHFHFFEKK